MPPTPGVYALILAGGAGTRFWPASRAQRPKQLLPLVGDTPLLRQTAERVLPLCAESALRSAALTGTTASAWDRILVATRANLAEATRMLLPEVPAYRFFLEPVARNTAPCIAWAAFTIARTDPEAVMMVLPSDHHIEDVERFRATVRAAIESARGGFITTIGIRPTRAETGFGYIEVEGAVLPERAQRGLKFVEKPDADRAAAYVADGRHLWNAGMFFFRAKDMVAAVQKYLPNMAAGLATLDQAAERGEEEQALQSVFPSLPSVSIDHGVMDNLPELAVVPGDFGWSDVGSFQSVWELASKDEHKNSAPAGSVVLDGKGNYVLDLRDGTGIKRVIALVGVDNLVVVETEDALLVTTRDHAQDVKLVVEELKKRDDTDLT